MSLHQLDRCLQTQTDLCVRGGTATRPEPLQGALEARRGTARHEAATRHPAGIARTRRGVRLEDYGRTVVRQREDCGVAPGRTVAWRRGGLRHGARMTSAVGSTQKLDKLPALNDGGMDHSRRWP